MRGCDFFQKLINWRVLFNEDVAGSYNPFILMKHANFVLIKTSVFHAQKSSEEHIKQQSSIL